MWKRKGNKRLCGLLGILAYILLFCASEPRSGRPEDFTLRLHSGLMHGPIHFFVALPTSMVQKGLRKRLVLPCGQYPDHALHSLTGPAPPLTLHAVAVEPVNRFRSAQVNLCVDTALAQAGDVGSVSLQIALQLVYGFQILFRSGTAPSCIHPDRDLFHDIVDSVEFPDNTIYQFPLAEAQPGPDFFMHMVAVTEMLMVLAAFYHLLKVLKLVPGPSISIR